MIGDALNAATLTLLAATFAKNVTVNGLKENLVAKVVDLVTGLVLVVATITLLIAKNAVNVVTQRQKPRMQVNHPPTLCGVLSDIDDTLTWEGRLVPSAFTKLHELQELGIKVVLVTGRPAGWVDHIARMWPVDAVVGENGGLWAYMEKGKLVQRYFASAHERAESRARLNQLSRHILKAFPGAGLASDQAYRALDLAIDFCEDVAPLPEQQVQAILQCFTDAGAHAKISSIHVNGWFGEWNKLDGVRQLFQELWDFDLESQLDQWVYFGDSANDEPMFEAFKYSVGVANIAPFLEQMNAHPKWITKANGGMGFCEGIEALNLGDKT